MTTLAIACLLERSIQTRVWRLEAMLPILGGQGVRWDSFCSNQGLVYGLEVLCNKWNIILVRLLSESNRGGRWRKLGEATLANSAHSGKMTKQYVRS